MNKSLLVFAFISLISLPALAQGNKQQSKKPQTEDLSNQLDHYQKEAQRLSNYSKKLRYKVAAVSSANKRLVIRVEKLKYDSLQLSIKLNDALTVNKNLVEAYETRIKGMSGELQALHDTLNTYRVVKRDLELIKGYISTLSLAPREYRQPYDKVLSILQMSLSKSHSPYEITRNSEQGLTVQEVYSKQKKVLLFFNKSTNIQATYVLTFSPNPVNEMKTLVKVRTQLQMKKGGDLIAMNDSNEETITENRLFNYMDKIIIQYQ